MEQGGGFLRRQIAEFEIEGAILRHDVKGGAAADRAGVDGGEGRLENMVEGTMLGASSHHVAQEKDHLGGVFDGIHTLGREGRVAFMPMHMAAHRHLAFMAVDHTHAGWLTDDTGARLDRQGLEIADQPGHPPAADFLVIGQGELDRVLQAVFGGNELRHHREGDGDEALHVGRAAPIHPSIALSQDEGIAVPILAVDGHRIGVTGQDDPGLFLRPDGGEEIGLASLGIEGQATGDAEAVQVIPHPIDQLQVRVPAGRVKADDPLNERQAYQTVGHRSPLTRFGKS